MHLFNKFDTFALQNTVSNSMESGWPQKSGLQVVQRKEERKKEKKEGWKREAERFDFNNIFIFQEITDTKQKKNMHTLIYIYI